MAKKVKIVYREPSVTNSEIKRLREEIEETQLKKKLKSIKGEEKKEPASPEDKARSEIRKLEEAKAKNIEAAEKAKQGQGRLGRFITGIQYGLGRANLNREINERRKFVHSNVQTRSIEAQVKAEKAKAELLSLKKVNTLSFDQISGMPSNSPSAKKGVRFEDLF